MKFEIENYTIECDINPIIENNANDIKIPIEDIGFAYNCLFKQKRAFEYSVKAIKKVYPDSKIYVVSDGGLDYSYMEDDNLKFFMEEDTVSDLKKVSGENFLKEEYQMYIKRGMAATLDRLERGIEYCGNPEWICMTEPDVLIRGKLTAPVNGKLLGSRINCGWRTPKALEQLMGINEIIAEIEGSIPVLRWGAVPVVFHTETFLKALKVYKENFNIVDKFSEKHYSPGTFDLFIGLVFALIGEPEVYNSEITECLRNSKWQTSGHPIVHQYREYYEQNDFYGVAA
jgi:hypothetical protein